MDDNMSRALLMGASILISIMVIGIGTMIFKEYGTFSSEHEEELYNKQIAQFNTQFLKYETMSDISIHDIITIANYAKDYNTSYGITDKPDKAYIHVNIKGMPNGNDIQEANTERKNELIQETILHNFKYELVNDSIEYNQATGRVNSITFRRKY